MVYRMIIREHSSINNRFLFTRYSDAFSLFFGQQFAIVSRAWRKPDCSQFRVKVAFVSEPVLWWCILRRPFWFLRCTPYNKIYFSLFLSYMAFYTIRQEKNIQTKPDSTSIKRRYRQQQFDKFH